MKAYTYDKKMKNVCRKQKTRVE